MNQPRSLETAPWSEKIRGRLRVVAVGLDPDKWPSGVLVKCADGEIRFFTDEVAAREAANW